MGVDSNLTVLDLCCGDGYFTAAFARITAGKVYGMDIDPEMLKRARAEVESHGVDATGWFCVDCWDVASLMPERVDYVFLANTFHGVTGQTDFAREVASVLMPQGRFGIVNWHAEAREETVVLNQPRGPRTELRMTPHQLQEVVGPAGFTLDQIVELPPYHYGAVFRLTDAGR